MCHIHFKRSFTVHHMPKRFRFLLAECSSAVTDYNLEKPAKWLMTNLYEKYEFRTWTCARRSKFVRRRAPHSAPGENINCTTPISPALFCSLNCFSKKQPEPRFILLLSLQYRCMLSSTGLQREIKRTFRPWFIYDCAIWALPTLEMQMERLRNFVSRWEHREHFNLTVSQLLTPPDATRRSYREMVSSSIILHFIDILLS